VHTRVCAYLSLSLSFYFSEYLFGAAVNHAYLQLLLPSAKYMGM